MTREYPAIVHRNYYKPLMLHHLVEASPMHHATQETYWQVNEVKSNSQNWYTS